MTIERQAFPSSVEFEILQYLPPSARPIYFPPPPGGNPNDGLILKVAAQASSSWIGVFPFGPRGGASVTGVYTCPSRQKLLVVASGSGTLIDAHRPGTYERVALDGINAVISVVPWDLLLVGNPFEMVAFGASETKWTTGRFAIDGFVVERIQDDKITGRLVPLEEDIDFEVDRVTGNVVGGISLQEL